MRIDLNNATQCWPYYWEMTAAEGDWYTSHYTVVYTRTYVITTIITTTSHLISGGKNTSWTSYCDGVLRFRNKAESISAIEVATLSPPITQTTTWYSTRTSVDERLTNPYGYKFQPKCPISGSQECQDIGSMWIASFHNSLEKWSSTNVLTISVASPPTLLVVNGRSTTLTAAPGVLPALPLHRSTFPAGSDGKWSIEPAYSNWADTTIIPGQEVTFTWNVEETMDPPFGPWGGSCPRPSDVVDEPACSTIKSCYIDGGRVELIYFPPPNTSRDLCAITSSGFDRYSQSIYSHPHVSTVINQTTFWMDKAYVRYDVLSAYKWCPLDNGLGRSVRRVGKIYASAYVEIESKDASTMCGIQFNPVRPYGLVIAATPYPLNFDDLNGRVPVSAYTC